MLENSAGRANYWLWLYFYVGLSVAIAMKTLSTLFGKERNELQTEIDKATSLKQVVKLVQNRVDNLEKIYIGDLSMSQVRLVNFFLDTLRQSLTIAGANETRLDSAPPQQVPRRTPSESNSLILKLLQGLTCIGILASLFSMTRSTPEAWMTILLMSLLVGLEVVKLFNKDHLDSPQPVEALQLQVPLDRKVFLDNLADALSSIDLAVAQAAEVKNTLGSSGIEEVPEILNFLQQLWGASLIENPIMTLELTKLIPQILMDQGIRAQNYQQNDEHSSRDYFDFEPNIDRSAKDYVTLIPALLKGDRLLRRGRVIEPAYSGARS